MVRFGNFDTHKGFGGVAQWLRALVAFTEDLDWVLSTPTAEHIFEQRFLKRAVH